MKEVKNSLKDEKYNKMVSQILQRAQLEKRALNVIDGLERFDTQDNLKRLNHLGFSFCQLCHSAKANQQKGPFKKSLSTNIQESDSNGKSALILKL